MKQQIIDALKEVYDPEISINVYDLGLIYEITLSDQEQKCDVLMTLTSAFCPMADHIVNEVKTAVQTASGIDAVSVEVTFDPPLTPDRMSDEAKLALGYDFSNDIDRDNLIFSSR